MTLFNNHFSKHCPCFYLLCLLEWPPSSFHPTGWSWAILSTCHWSINIRHTPKFYLDFFLFLCRVGTSWYSVYVTSRRLHCTRNNGEMCPSVLLFESCTSLLSSFSYLGWEYTPCLHGHIPLCTWKSSKRHIFAFTFLHMFECFLSFFRCFSYLSSFSFNLLF